MNQKSKSYQGVRKSVYSLNKIVNNIRSLKFESENNIICR